MENVVKVICYIIKFILVLSVMNVMFGTYQNIGIFNDDIFDCVMAFLSMTCVSAIIWRILYRKRIYAKCSHRISIIIIEYAIFSKP